MYYIAALYHPPDILYYDIRSMILDFYTFVSPSYISQVETSVMGQIIFLIKFDHIFTRLYYAFDLKTQEY
jgi:predicted AlkP superfamily phosphohydrolase/phosphomutase